MLEIGPNLLDLISHITGLLVLAFISWLIFR